MIKQRIIDLIGIRNPIFAGNLERMGLLRILPAMLAMYLLIPVFLFLHLICLMLLYNWIVCPLLGVERVRLRNYIIIDRHKLPGLSYTGRFHCIYCGYANGICVAFGVMLTQVSTVSIHPEAAMQRWLAALFFFSASILSSAAQSFVILVYNLAIAPPLGLHRLSRQEVYATMQQNGFADDFLLFGEAGQKLIRYEQGCYMLLAGILEQIESMWCPVKHLDREGAVFPDHHRFFVERCELCELKRILSCEGSVSPRKPKY